MKRKLVVYYSFSGSTRALAQEIARQAGADLRELIPEKPYSFERNTAIKELRNEMERGACPKLTSGEEPVVSYDAVFIGSPNWLTRFAPPVLTFLRRTDLAGKTVVPFCTSGGGGFGRMIQGYTKECPNATILPGLATTSGFSPAEVSRWLKEIGLSVE